MSEPRADLLIRAARAIDALFDAESYVQAAEEGVDTPANAAPVCWDAAANLRAMGERFTNLADVMTFTARRMERAEREERATGVEFRGGSSAA